MRARLGARRSTLAIMLVTAGVLSALPAGLSSVVPAAPAVAAPYCGPTVAKADGTAWVCTFADEFTGDSLDSSKWLALTTANNGFTAGGECFVNNPNNIRVSQGSLRLTVRKERKKFTCARPSGNFTTQYTGGYATSWNRFAQTYGRYEIRARFPATHRTGLHSALWLYPKTHAYGAWPASGEIDIAEFYTRYPDRVIPHLHYKKAQTDANVTNNYCMVTDPDTWHTYVLEWTPTSLTISYDGQVCLKTTSWYPDGLSMPAPFDKPFYLNLTQALGRGHNQFDPATTKLPGSMYVDYVRVWS